VPGQHLVLVEPAADASTLERIVEPAGEWCVGLAVADEAGIELNGTKLAEQRRQVSDDVLGDADATQEDFGDFPSDWTIVSKPREDGAE
jgi:hypothetical protein